MDEGDVGIAAIRKSLKVVRDFLYHLMVFLFVGGLLVILDVRAGAGDMAVLGMDWAYWVILFWGLGVVGHVIFAFFGEHRVEARYERERRRELTHV